MSQLPALRDVVAKLDGAQERLEVLKGRLDQGAVTELLTTRTDRDRKGRVRVRVRELAEVPQEWHVWIGECIHDMRSALDHLAYALNVAGSQSDPPANSSKSQFPIYSERSRFRRMAQTPAAECPMGYFPRGARTRVERLQPYHRWKDLDTAWLGVLAGLSNIDKHRGFPVTVTTPWLLQAPETVEGHAVTDSKVLTLRPLKADATFMWLVVATLPPGTQEPRVNFPYACNLLFDRRAAPNPIPLVLPYEQVGFVLGMTLAHIRGRILPTLEPCLG